MKYNIKYYIKNIKYYAYDYSLYPCTKLITINYKIRSNIIPNSRKIIKIFICCSRV